MTDFQKAKEAAIAAIEEIEPVLDWSLEPGEGLDDAYIPADKVLTAALSAFREAGYVLVPIEPSHAMIAAADNLANTIDGVDCSPAPEISWDAMLTAAQKEQEG